MSLRILSPLKYISRKHFVCFVKPFLGACRQYASLCWFLNYHIPPVFYIWAYKLVDLGHYDFLYFVSIRVCNMNLHCFLKWQISPLFSTGRKLKYLLLPDPEYLCTSKSIMTSQCMGCFALLDYHNFSQLARLLEHVPRVVFPRRDFRCILARSYRMKECDMNHDMKLFCCYLMIILRL